EKGRQQFPTDDFRESHAFPARDRPGGSLLVGRLRSFPTSHRGGIARIPQGRSRQLASWGFADHAVPQISVRILQFVFFRLGSQSSRVVFRSEAFFWKTFWQGYCYGCRSPITIRPVTPSLFRIRRLGIRRVALIKFFIRSNQFSRMSD